MKKPPIATKHILWIILAVATLATIVLLSVFADGRNVETAVAFALGLLVPGSVLGGIVRGEQ